MGGYCLATVFGSIDPCKSRFTFEMIRILYLGFAKLISSSLVLIILRQRVSLRLPFWDARATV